MAALDLAWTGLVAVLAGLLVFGLLAIVWLTRERRSHRTRMGVFLERNGDEPPNDVDD